MHFTAYQNHSVDVADIWQYERNCYASAKSGNKDRHSIGELYDYLQQFYLDEGHEPFILASDQSDYANGYRERYDNRDKEILPPDIFMSRGHIYDMAEPCEVSLTEYNQLAFQRLFILKLSQYSDGLLYIQQFLQHQLKLNFKNSLSRLQNFLKLSLLQYPDKIDEKIKKVVEDWLMDMEKKESTKSQKLKLKRSKRSNNYKPEQIKMPEENVATIQNEELVNYDEEVSESNIDSLNRNNPNPTIEAEISVVPLSKNRLSETAEENIAETLGIESAAEIIVPAGNELILGIDTKVEVCDENFESAVLKKTEVDHLFESSDSWETVDIGLTENQVRAFFSFLYLEKNNRGLPFLEKDKTEKVFQFGFKVPPIPSPERFKLNLTPQCRRSMIEKCVYIFYEKYSNNLKNKHQFLKFLAYNFLDFSKFKTQADFKNWSKNFNLTKFSAELPFDIHVYVEKVRNV